MQALLDEEKNYATLDELMKFAPAVDNFFEKVINSIFYIFYLFQKSIT